MVTGATAPLGIAVVERLLAMPEVAFVLAVGLETGAPGVADRDNIIYRRVDLTHQRAVHDLVWGDARQRRIDTVIHAAQHRAAMDEGRAVHRQNVEATRAMLVACTDHPSIRRFVLRSFAEVYAMPNVTTQLLTETAALDFGPASPQWVRDRVEADVTAGSHTSSFEVAVLRCAELMAPRVGSQLWDYLSSRVCLRPLGFDPIVNVISLHDAARALVAAARSSAVGAFNIPGADTLPLSKAIDECDCLNVGVPGPLMSPLYRLRRRVAGFEFRYDLNARRFHFGGVLDGTRAREKLGYVPEVHVTWPKPWWRLLLGRLATLHAPEDAH